MAYSLYCSHVPLQSKYMPELRSLVPVNFKTKEGAIGAACTLIKAGSIVWQIKGPDDDIMQRAEIETACRRREFA
jgi:hypothetical protein